MKLPSLPEGEITAIEVHRANPYVELGISIVGGNETPLINIVIQEVYRDGVIARDGRLLAGDQILQVSGHDSCVERVQELMHHAAPHTAPYTQNADNPVFLFMISDCFSQDYVDIKVPASVYGILVIWIDVL